MPNGYTNWCGTRQLGEEPDMEAWLRHLFESGKAKFIIGQVEQGSHLHLQFYIQREKSLIGKHEEGDMQRNSLGTSKRLRGRQHQVL